MKMNSRNYFKDIKDTNQVEFIRNVKGKLGDACQRDMAKSLGDTVIVFNVQYHF